MSETMLNALMVVQIVIGAILIVSILLQNRSEGIGQLFGGGGGGEHFRTRRGLEAFLYYGTVVLIVFFVAISFTIVKYSG